MTTPRTPGLAASAHTRLELDSEVLQAETPEQFRGMLAKIAATANLKPSQIAVKSGIPRSQAYALTKPAGVLPSKPEQIQAFLRVCNVAPEQAAEVMELWTRLYEAARETGSARSDRLGTTAATAASEGFVHGAAVVASGEIAHHTASRDFYINTIHHSAAGELVALVRYVVADERRTNRALRLLTRAGTLMIGMLLFVGHLLTLLPQSVAMWVAACLGVLFVVAVVAGVVALRRVLQAPRLIDG